MLIKEVYKEHEVKKGANGTPQEFMNDERRLKEAYKKKVLERMRNIKNEN